MNTFRPSIVLCSFCLLAMIHLPAVHETLTSSGAKMSQGTEVYRF